ncbi:MAG: 3-isopropylmalate dehydratase large subunit [Bacteroidales bacterium]|nr:3-isopropylmalate dehydratase large subunit [Bacteroidales bacterium]
MTIIEKILAKHVRSGSGSSSGSQIPNPVSQYTHIQDQGSSIEYPVSSSIVKPGDIVDVDIDVRMARDFGGAGVVKHLEQYNLAVADRSKTFFTFDCNPTGSDQQYATNQQRCRLFARAHQIDVYDINAGIGTHLAIDEGLAVPGSTLVSTDSHANIVGAIGAFGQGMGDRDIAAAWSRGSVWFRVPETVKITLTGERPENLSAKDIVLNLLKAFGADGLLGCAVELYGEEVEILTLDERITISSMATEMGAITIIIPPSSEVIAWCREHSYLPVNPVYADHDARYSRNIELDISLFTPLVSLPGQPHHVTPVADLGRVKIDSAFVGSCTNGRISDMKEAARLLKGRKVAPGVVLKIVPSTDEVWNASMHLGYFEIFKAAGALVGNAGCAGCASGQIGQNGLGEVTISTGNRNFAGKQGKGDVYLASVSTAVASAIAGYITTADNIPDHPMVSEAGTGSEFATEKPRAQSGKSVELKSEKSRVIEGKVWLILRNNIDTDMIYHNRHLAVTDITEMGRYALGNLQGWEDFPQKAQPGDILITGKNFGSGSSRQHAVDCFSALGIKAILAESFGAIYERNAINAGFPVLTYTSLDELELVDRDPVAIDLEGGTITNQRNNKSVAIGRFSEIQKKIYEAGDLLLAP